jgi:hypothetical protein
MGWKLEDGFKITLELGPQHPLFDASLKGLVDYHVYNLAPRSDNKLVLNRAKALSLETSLPVFPHLRVQEPLEDLWPEVRRAFLIRGESEEGPGFESTEAALKVLPLEGRDIRVACYPEVLDRAKEWARMRRVQALGVSAFVTDFILDISRLECFLKGCPSVPLIVSLLPGIWENLEKLGVRFPYRRLPKVLPESGQFFLKELQSLLRAYGHHHLQICSQGDPRRAVSLFKQ